MRPMLPVAKKNPDPASYQGWVADQKLDGLRALIFWRDNDVRIVNRNEVDITWQFPEIEVALTRALHGHPSLVLDSEIIADDGLFNTVATRGKQTQALSIVNGVKSNPCHLVIFDVLYYGTSIMARPFVDRRATMQHLVEKTGLTGVATSHNPVLLFDHMRTCGFEGIIVKNPRSTYQPDHRSQDWVKIKILHRVTCIGTGYDKGQGARTVFGAMHLVMIRSGVPVSVGRVGTGFNTNDIDFLKSELDAKHPVLCEIECLNRTVSGQLRFPVYVGPRPDLSIADANVDQLNLLPLC